MNQLSLKDILKINKSDKYNNKYYECYEELFEKFRNKKNVIAEIGVLFGNSIISWGEYFKNSKIYGLDIFHSDRFNNEMKSFGAPS